METAEFGIMAIHPVFGIDAAENPAIAIAAARAGGIGIYDVEFLEPHQVANGCRLLLRHAAGGRCGIRCGVDQIETLGPVLESLATGKNSSNVVLLCAGTKVYCHSSLQCAISSLRRQNLTVFCEVVSLHEAVMAQGAGAEAIIVKGNEAGGRVGEETSPVLLQRCRSQVSIPIWLRGGIGPYTASAARVGGAAGVVLDNQLLLLRESPLGPLDREVVARLDGTETVCLALGGNDQFRLRLRNASADGAALQEQLSAVEQAQRCGGDEQHDASQFDESGVCAQEPDSQANRRAIVYGAVKRQLQRNSGSADMLPLGQEAAFAARFAERYDSVATTIAALRRAVHDNCHDAAACRPFAEASPLAVSNGTQYPLLQGAMTRVSDTSAFAQAVARAGALPFLALALMRGPEVEQLLKSTIEAAGEAPWGVGILGFVPHQLRQEQTAVIEKFRPPFALIAGGRPDQSAELERLGIRTYLHVPSPLLLESFIEAGCRRFIFEGRECGGHVGPRSSFVLWEQMIEVLLESLNNGCDAASFDVVFAGGIHDHLSAAMVAALAAPLAVRGVKLGLLMGTAYLFTQEAVDTGAICEKFQQAAIDCTDTVLFETGPGHAIRCLTSPYKSTFDETRRNLEQSGRGKNEIRQELELMNLGRLRTASKGVARAETGSQLVSVSQEKQWHDGMYMIGQVAALHEQRTTMAQLHDAVCRTGSELLSKFQKPSLEISCSQKGGGEAVAIVGMSCLFPKANDLQQFWENILNKVDTIEPVPTYQWDADRLYSPDPLARDKIYSKWGGFVQDIPFDPSIYGIPPSSLASIDPLQLLILEVTRAALADAGFSTRGFNKQATSVFLANAGHGPITAFYSLRSMLDWTLADMPAEYRKIVESRLPEWTEDSFPGYLGNVIAGRVANRFDLGGVNFCIDAACASSLAALHAAMRELRAGTSECVLLASTDTHNQPGDYLSFSKTHALSPRGKCRTFDATADGIVISEGVAVLVLKRLSDAERDGDRIYAVIRGIGGSSDGRDLSLTAPRPAGQMLALTRAYEDAAISPQTVGLVEAHGTGTVAGDKAEVEALTKVFAAAGAGRQSCAIGSVKTMIGHTKCSAGLASMIKVAKSLYHKVLPPTIGVDVPNPACKFPSGPFYVNAEARPWLNAEEHGPRRAGVSAFGFGGTNFHAILEEYTGPTLQHQESAYRSLPAELFLLRANSREGLQKSLASLASMRETALKQSQRPAGPVNEPARLTLADMAFKTFVKGQGTGKPSKFTLALVTHSLEDLAAKIAQAEQALADSSKTSLRDPRGVYFAVCEKVEEPRVAFLFPGQGAQQVNMLKDLSLVFKDVRQAFEKSDEVLKNRLDTKLSSYVFPPPAFSDQERIEQQQALIETRIAQPAVAAAGMAAFKLLKGFGLEPHAVAGHSFGEYIALAAAGSLSEADLLAIAELRGDILSRANGECRGAMAAVAAGEEQLTRLMPLLPGITLANVNSPNQCILSGDTSAIDGAISKLNSLGMKAKSIAVSAAFHSPLMQPARDELFAALTLLNFQEPSMQVYSNTTTGLYPKRPEEYAQLLAEHLVAPVAFQREIEQIYSSGIDVFVECGPGTILTGLVNDTLADKPHLAVSIDRNGRNGVTQLLHALALLAVRGVNIDQQRLYAHRFEGTAKENPATGKQARKLFYVVNSAQIRRFDPETGSINPAPVRTPTDEEVKERSAVKLTGPAQSVAPSGRDRGGAPSAAGMHAGVASGTASEELNGNGNGNGNGKHQLSRSELSGIVQNASNRLASPSGDKNGGGSGKREDSANKRQEGSVSSSFVSQTPVKAPAENRVIDSRINSGGTPATNLADSVNRPASGKPSFNKPESLLLNATSGLTVRDRVMVDFQQNMLQMTANFLSTQERVMMAYLGACDGETPSERELPTGGETVPADSGVSRKITVSQRTDAHLQPQVHPHLHANAPSAMNVSVPKVSGNGQHGTPNSAGGVGQTAGGANRQIQNDLRTATEGNGRSHQGEAARSTASTASTIVRSARPVEPASSVPLPTVAGAATAPGAVLQSSPLSSTANLGASSLQLPNAKGENIDPEFLIVSLINIVSERTGYPVEMLDPQLDLEADLGIDSIKRVEILNNFRKLLPETRQQSLEDGIEKLAGTRTLQGIMDWIRDDLFSPNPKGPSVEAAPSPNHAAAQPAVAVQKSSYVARALLKAVRLAPLSHPVEPLVGLHLIAGPPSVLADLVCANLHAKGVKAVRLVDTPQAPMTGLPGDHSASQVEDTVPAGAEESVAGPRNGVVLKSAVSVNTDACGNGKGEGGNAPSQVQIDLCNLESTHSELLKLTAGEKFVSLVYFSSACDVSHGSSSEATNASTAGVSADGAASIEQRAGAAGKDTVASIEATTTAGIGTGIGVGIDARVTTRATEKTAAGVGDDAAASTEADAGIAACRTDDACALPQTESADIVAGAGEGAARRSVYSLFCLSKALHAVLPPQLPWTWLAVTSGDGTFGVEEPMVQPLLAAIGGLAKTVAREWAEVKARVVQFSRFESLAERALLVEAELAHIDDRVEVGYRKGERRGVEVEPSTFQLNGTDPQKMDLDRSSVVLVTGGARGITSDLVYSLARDYRPTLVILGRGERPRSAEPAWAAGLSNVAELKSAIMAELKRTGQKVTVPAVEGIYRELLKNREIRDNLAKLESTGATVQYYALDVRKADQLGALIDRIYESSGRIDAVIHGAGVIEDAFIKDKSLDSFDRVFRTKVDSALVLARKLQLDSLKYLVLFSSVVGRTGNAGQADYVAANEVINKLAGTIQQRATGRVVSIGWGPWRAGMARPEMESMFARYGWAMIEVGDGIASFRQEFAYGSSSNVEVLLVGKPLNGPEGGPGETVNGRRYAALSDTASGARSDTNAAATATTAAATANTAAATANTAAATATTATTAATTAATAAATAATAGATAATAGATAVTAAATAATAAATAATAPVTAATTAATAATAPATATAAAAAAAAAGVGATGPSPGPGAMAGAGASSPQSEIRSLVKSSQAANSLKGVRLRGAHAVALTDRSLELSLTLDPQVDLYLLDHTIDGVAVLPMAIAAELFAEVACSLRPAFQLASLEKMQIPCGVVFDGGAQELLLKAVVQDEDATQAVLDLTLSSFKNKRRICFKCQATMTGTRTKLAVESHMPDRFRTVAVTEPVATLPDAGFIYRHWMFHGKLFQGIESVHAMGTNVVVGTVSTSPLLECLKLDAISLNGDAAAYESSNSQAGARADQWTIDPILLDSSMQVGGIWSRQYFGITALPTGFRRLWRLAPLTGQRFNVIVSIPPGLGGNELICDVAVYDSTGKMVLLMEGLTGVGNKELNRLAEQQNGKPLRAVPS